MESYETYETDDKAEEWYENDLQLAAELGKALLERNRDLEAQVQQLQQTNHEQSLEIDFLSKQADTIRTMNESRMRIYEDLDRNSQELEKQNQKLISDSKSDKQKIDRYAATVEHLEQRVEELLRKVEEYKAAEKAALKQDKRRTHSLASLNETNEMKSGFFFENLTWTYSEKFKNLPLNPYEIEIRTLQDSLQHMKSLKTIERRKREDLELENSFLIQENEILENRISSLETKLSEVQTLERELRQSKSSEKLCWKCESTVVEEESQTRIMKEVEHDAPELISEGKAVKLGGGGSLYGSSESINKVATDAQEIAGKEVDDSGRSILDELETQYKNLFQKYEAVIQGKTKRHSGDGDDTAEERMRKKLANKGVQTLLNLTLSKDFTQDTGQPPPYKVIFKELFATLRKSRIEETTERTTPSPATTPVSPGVAEAKTITGAKP